MSVLYEKEVSVLPGVDIYYRPYVMDEGVAQGIKDAIRAFGIAAFSTEKLELNRKSFSFKFHTPNDFDALSCDIIVRIRLRHPVPNFNNTFAARLAWEIKELYSDLGASVGVELMRAEAVWGSVTREQSPNPLS